MRGTFWICIPLCRRPTEQTEAGWLFYFGPRLLAFQLANVIGEHRIRPRDAHHSCLQLALDLTAVASICVHTIGGGKFRTCHECWRQITALLEPISSCRKITAKIIIFNLIFTPSQSCTLIIADGICIISTVRDVHWVPTPSPRYLGMIGIMLGIQC